MLPFALLALACMVASAPIAAYMTLRDQKKKEQHQQWFREEHRPYDEMMKRQEAKLKEENKALNEENIALIEENKALRERIKTMRQWDY